MDALLVAVLTCWLLPVHAQNSEAIQQPNAHGPGESRDHVISNAAEVSEVPSCRDQLKGFDRYCDYWDKCIEAPLSVTRSGDRCLFGRVVGASTDVPIGNQTLAGGHRRLFLVQGQDAVAKLAKRHCTPEGRGQVLLNVGWTNPVTTGLFTYAIFARPCSVSTEPSRPWTPASAPTLASWPGVEAAIRVAYNSTAGEKVWQEMAKHYSFVGGGLGLAGIVNYGQAFLAQCVFGDRHLAGCCAPQPPPPERYYQLAKAFSHPAASPVTERFVYKDPAVLRAFLANAIDLNAFFNGNGVTFDGCGGLYTILSSHEYILPNKHDMHWGNLTDTVTIGEVIRGGNGLAFTWGPEHLCNVTGSKVQCDARDGTVVSEKVCSEENGLIPRTLAPFIFGGATAPCERRPLVPLVV